MKSCVQCRKAKRKCVRHETDLLTPCTRCLRHNIFCSSARSGARNQIRPLAVKTTSSGPDCPRHLPLCVPPSQSILDDFLADKEAVAEMVRHYLTKLHDRPHSIFHPETLWKNIHAQQVPRPLLLSICALGAHLSNRSTSRSLEPLLTSESKRLLRQDLENITLENIQACILVANLCAAHGNPSSEFLFFQIAITMVKLMEIPTENPTGDAITQEVKIRVWWTLFMADNWCCSGLGFPRQMKECPRPTRLPLDEGVFASLTYGQPSTLELYDNLGLWAHMLTLVELFAPIQELNRRVAQDKDLQQSQIEQDTTRLADRLIEWQNDLPQPAKLTETNLLAHAGRGTGGPFLALHLGFHHYATLLFYQYLDTHFMPTAHSISFSARCKHHARSYSNLLVRGRQHTGCEAVYPTVAHMTIVSSSVLLHTLLFGTEEELAESRHCLHTNFAALLELEQYWPCVETMINRLMNFQKTCLLLTHSHMHRVDRWMVRFLFEYALPLNDKAPDPPRSAADLEIISAQARFFSQQGRLTTFGNVSE